MAKQFAMECYDNITNSIRLAEKAQKQEESNPAKREKMKQKRKEK